MKCEMSDYNRKEIPNLKKIEELLNSFQANINVMYLYK